MGFKELLLLFFIYSLKGYLRAFLVKNTEYLLSTFLIKLRFFLFYYLFTQSFSYHIIISIYGLL